MPRILLATLCLNEMEWLPALYDQHREWPGVVGWCFVEAADRKFAEANPSAVSAEGLSTDGTGIYLRTLANLDACVRYVPHGFSEAADPAQGKCAARQRYLDVAGELGADWVIVVDADEFYSRRDQERISGMLDREAAPLCFPQRHVWRPPSLPREPLFEYEVVDGYWAIPHCRVWPYVPGAVYRQNHNYVELPNDPTGDVLASRMQVIRDRTAPNCVHLAFAGGLAGRAAKHAYYAARGEGKADHRGWYVECRRAWETWQPGDSLPHGAKVVSYGGPVPEVFT